MPQGDVALTSRQRGLAANRLMCSLNLTGINRHDSFADSAHSVQILTYQGTETKLASASRKKLQGTYQLLTKNANLKTLHPRFVMDDTNYSKFSQNNCLLEYHFNNTFRPDRP